MAYGELKVDSITFTDGGSDVTVSVSGLAKNPTFSGDIVVSGNISGITVTGDSAGFGSVTGVTVTGTTANFVTVSGTTVTGDTGNFTSVSATTATITSGVFASGTAAAPSVSVGTTDNGLYSPGTDEVAISTNGVGRVFIDASGNVGVNAAPRFNLSLGATTVASTSTPQTIDLGGSYSDTAGTNAKLRLYWDGTGQFGFGVSAGQLDYIAPTGGIHVFHIGGTERTRIDSSGRLLVGTSNARSVGTITSALQVEGSTPSTSSINLVNNGDNTGPSTLRLGKVRPTGAVINDDLLGSIAFCGHDGNDLDTPGAYINAMVDGAVSVDDLPTRLVFSTTADGASSPTERMRIDSSGFISLAGDTDTGFSHPSANTLAFDTGGSEAARIDSSGRLLVGTSTSLESNSFLQVYKASGRNYLRIESASLANDDSSIVYVIGGARSQSFGIYKHSGITNPCGYLSLNCEDNATNFVWADNSDQLRISTAAGHIGTTSGTVVGTQTSDERIKNILGPVKYGLDTLKQIEPVRYSLKSEPETEKLGFIAQQVLPLVPESVFNTNEQIEGEPEDAPTKLGMEYVSLIPVLVNAIKELSAEVDALKTQLQAS